MENTENIQHAQPSERVEHNVLLNTLHVVSGTVTQAITCSDTNNKNQQQKVKQAKQKT